MNLNLSDLLSLDYMKALNADKLANKKFTGISTDSRTIKLGQIFFAIQGEKYDGNKFIRNAFTNGAACAVVGKNANIKQCQNHPIFFVKDTTKAFGKLANIYRNKFEIPFIAVAGSNGKTTTKEMITAVLSTKYNVLSTQGNLNNHIGVPQTLFRLNDNHDVAVIEIGTNHIGELKYLCEVLHPTHGLITNIGYEHLEFFHNLSGVAKAEGELFQSLNYGCGFINNDDKRIVAKARLLKKKYTYGFSKAKVDVQGKFIGMNAHGYAKFEIIPEGKKSFTIELPLPGSHAMQNALAAVAVGLSFGVSSKNIQYAVKNFKPVSKRMEIITVGGGRILNDTYNANSDSVLSAIETIHSMKCTGKKIIILADMLELGSTANREHKRVAVALNKMKFDHVITFGQLAKVIHDYSHAKGKMHFVKKDRLCDYAEQIAGRGDLILVKGSRGMKMEEVVVRLQNYLRKIS
jgi:UDP-N-acetylmuramoyl-tripeptide--D-alanyl-D-alanine ligase